jgi:hypothetical protein
VWVFIVFEPADSQGYVPAYTVAVEDMAALPPCSAPAPA